MADLFEPPTPGDSHRRDCTCHVCEKRRFDAQHQPVDLDEQIASVRRELAMRARNYPRWVLAGRMTQEASDREMSRMQAVHDTLMKLRA